MRIHKIFSSLVTLTFILSLACSLQAENKNKTFYGAFLFGYRSVDTSGAKSKYKEDINLESGLRLFNLDFHYVPEEKANRLFDRLDLNIYNYGGDPFEIFSLSIQKAREYTFQYERKKAIYFYQDLHQIGQGTLFDYHTFDFERIVDSGLFKIWLGKVGHLYLNFDKFSRKGSSVTTFDINRIEFEFDKPIKEDSKEVTIGVDFNLNRYSLILEEKILDYKNKSSLFLPGYADGGPEARYPSSLSLFELNQPYDLKAYTHTIKFNARPFNSLLLAGSAQMSNLDLDLTYSEEADGVDYLNRIFRYIYSGEGSFNRKIQLYDFDLTYMLLKRLAIVGAVRYQNFDQDGSFTVNSEKETAVLGYNTFGYEGGLQFQFSGKLALTLGYRNETRKLENLETVLFEEKTIRKGFFGNVRWDPSSAFKLTLDYQRGNYDNPFTLISPTSSNRFKVAFRASLKKFNLSGSYLLSKTRSEIDVDLFEAERNQLNFRFGYNGEKIKIFSGYSLIDVERKGTRSVAYSPFWTGPGGTFLWDILYEGKSSLYDLSLSFNLKEDWKIGAYANSYENKGFWRISRAMLRAYLEYTFVNGFITQVGYRYVNFKEKDSGFNDYKTSILEISLGYRWD